MELNQLLFFQGAQQIRDICLARDVVEFRAQRFRADSRQHLRLARVFVLQARSLVDGVAQTHL